jgi:histidinol-phosphatase (PHP family)
MKFLSNAHTHTTYCDGLSTVEEQLASARRLGFASLGFSGHAMQGFDWKYCMSEEGQRAYRAQLRALQRRHAELGLSPKLYVGLEQDALTPASEKAKNRADFDYIITSTHYFPEPLHGAWVAVDGYPDLLKRSVAERFGGDALAMAEAYFALHGAAVESDRPDVIGHFDLVRKYAEQVGLDTGAAGYRAAALRALERARRGCGLLEVNTGGIARGYEDTPFPAGFLLDAWRDMGGSVTLTSDCHDARYLDCAFDETLVMLKSRGFTCVTRLGAGAEPWDEIPLT